MRMLVLGAGMQGSAAAFDLLRQDDVEEVRLADVAVGTLKPFLQPYLTDGPSNPRRLRTIALDVKDAAAVQRALAGGDAALSAAPHYPNAAPSPPAPPARV